MREFAVLAIVIMLATMIGCGETPVVIPKYHDTRITINGKEIDRNKAVAGARVIARSAGMHVAAKNPMICAGIANVYKTIQATGVDEFRSAFLAGLKQYLKQTDIAGSDTLETNANDILMLYGLPAGTTVDLELIEQVPVDDIKAIVGAFIEGMGLSAG